MNQREIGSTTNSNNYATSNRSLNAVTRRSRLETYVDIMRAMGAGAEKPTHIMFKVNLSWSVASSYLKALENQGLVVSTDEQGKRLYHLSEKGLSMLKQFVMIKDKVELIPATSDVIRGEPLPSLELENELNVATLRAQFGLSSKPKKGDALSRLRGMLNEYSDNKTDAVSLLHSVRDED